MTESSRRFRWAAIAALEGPQDCVKELAARFQRRRHVLVKGLHGAAWDVAVPCPGPSRTSVHRFPKPYRAAGSLEFTRRLINDAKVSVSPGIGFGEYGDGHVRFALIENENRLRQALRGVKDMLRRDALVAPTG